MQQVSARSSFLRLDRTPLHVYPPFRLSICRVMDAWVVLIQLFNGILLQECSQNVRCGDPKCTACPSAIDGPTMSKRGCHLSRNLDALSEVSVIWGKGSRGLHHSRTERRPREGSHEEGGAGTRGRVWRAAGGPWPLSIGGCHPGDMEAAGGLWAGITETGLCGCVSPCCCLEPPQREEV